MPLCIRAEALALIAAVGLASATSVVIAASPVAGPNINMITGTKWPVGDPSLTKQNEPTIAVSSVNPRHLVAGSNDYRLVDPAIPIPGHTADAWVTLMKSIDGGVTWRTSLIPGCPLDIPECNAPLPPTNAMSPVKGQTFAADPTVRPGPYGTFFYSFIAADRGTGAGGVTAVQRIIDRNDAIRFDDDPFGFDVVNIIDTGTTGQFKDKPWVAADVPGRAWNAGTCVIPGYNNNNPVPAFNVYLTYSNFVGQSSGNPHPQILVSRSTDCGATFGKPVKLSQSVDTNSASMPMIDPQSGTVYVVWRRFADPSAGTGDALYMSYSNDGGNKWIGPTLVAPIIPFDQGDNGTTFRTNDTPTIAVSVDSGRTSRLHVAFSQRKAAVDPATLSCTAADGNCDARIMLMSATIRQTGNSIGSLGAWQTKAIDDWQSDARFNGEYPGSWPTGGHRRGHQVMPALAFAGGKLMAVWLDQRYDHTIGRLLCHGSSTRTDCDSLLQFQEIRVPAFNGNLISSAGIPTVFTPYLTDGTPGLGRRHTLDVFGAMASIDDPALTFTSTRISRYAFGVLKAKSAQQETSYNIDQLQQNPPNVPIAAGGTIPFIGDYTDLAAQLIVPTADAARPYAFNCGVTAGPFCSAFEKSPAFYPSWTDNRDVVRPKNGDWTRHTPIAQFPGSDLSNVCMPGQDASRNSNVYTAIVADGAFAYPNANSKLLDATSPRGFVIGVQNLVEPANAVAQNYRSFVLSIADTTPGGGSASFDPVDAVRQVVLSVPPISSASRSVWVKSATPGARVRVDVRMILDGAGNPLTTPVTDADAAHFTNVRTISQIVLNPDPKGTLVGNMDGAGAPDIVANNQGIAGDEEPATVLVDVNPLTVSGTAYALSNAGTTNLALNNLALNNLALSNYALNNLALNNLALNNLALNNLALSNYALNNYALNNTTDYNYALSNYALNNYALNNVTIDNTDLTNLALSNEDLANLALSNYALNNYALSNNSFTNLALNNQSVVDTTVTITNEGNTDTTLALKTLLRDGNIPAGMSIQLLLRKVALSPAASVIAPTQTATGTIGSCTVGLVQQNSQVASFAQPDVIAPADAGLVTFPSASPLETTADPLAATLPLSAKERAYVTLRVVGPSCTTGQRVIDCATFRFAKYGTKIVAVDASKTTTQPAPTQVPLVITSFILRTVPGASASLTATGGYGTLQWSATPGAPALPNGVTLQSDGTVLVDAAVAAGDYPLYVSITDQGAPPSVPPQYDQQLVTLRVIGFTFTGEPPTKTQLQVGEVLPLTGSSSTGEPVTFSLDPATTPGACTLNTAVNPPTLTGGPNPGTCVLVVTVGDASIVQTVDVIRTFTVKAAQTLTYAPPTLAHLQQLTLPAATDNPPAQPLTWSLVSGPCLQSGLTLTANAGTGTCAVTASAPGTVLYLPYGPATFQFALGKALQTIAPDAGNPSSVAYASTFTVKAATSSGLALVFTSLTPATCSVTATAYSAPTTTATVASVATGLCTLQAAQSGNADFQAASLVLPAISIDKTSQTVTFDPVPGDQVYPSTITVNATASTGPIAYTVSGNCTSSGASVTLVSPGSCTVTATAPENALYKAAQASTTFLINLQDMYTLIGSMAQPRSHHTATRFDVGPLAGWVLVAGGFDADGAPTATSELYNPATRTFSPTGNLPSKAAGHSATLLSNGKVLALGGGNSSAETYDPVARTWSPGGSMSSTRSYHTAAVLGDGTGRVLVAGGADNAGKTIGSTILYNPSTGTFANGPNLTSARERHTAVSLPSGKVLIVGGQRKTGANYVTLASAEICDATACTALAAPSLSARHSHAAVMVANDAVVLVGGANGAADLASAEVLAPSTGAVTPAGTLQSARRELSATGLPNGRVVAAGGRSGATPQAASDLYKPPVAAGAAMNAPRAAHTATPLKDAAGNVINVLIVGGVGSTGKSVSSAEIYGAFGP